MSNVLNLFSGAGGWEVGALMVGADPVTGIEIDPVMVETARAAGHHSIQGDVTKFDPKAFGDVVGELASPVCTGMSIAGKGAGRGDRAAILAAIDRIGRGAHVDAVIAGLRAVMADQYSALVLEPLRYALALEPEWVAWEQVPAVAPLWDACAGLLAERGYSVWTGKVRAEQFGVPQTRTRAVLLGSRTRLLTAPVPTHSAYHSQDPARLDVGVLPWVSMATALGFGMSHRPSGSSTAGGTCTGGAEPFGNGARRGMLREHEAGRWVMRSNYGTGGDAARRGERADDQPAQTVTGKIDRNKWIGGERVTNVSVGEAAVLQSFPADYPFRGGKGKQCQQVGNAVPPLLAAHLIAQAAGLGAPGKASQ